ncbi:LytR family transcriptional regulator [[Ruminococcus] lactaris]|jgi:LCP family protein required for cell wall assembly|uniref:LytR family transcriptional regulator n=1 Tax=[Ruminococcus] lactaris TaxID=46228 RepID=A0A3E4LZQ3_9FIRM|nr:LCP family protein [[Ruminococcus] lactaris]RGK42953.1 LytR family transcriptional regulator [[Ruminococcus] lactaris]
MERQRKTAKNTSHNRRGRVKESKRSKRNRFGAVCIVIQTIASIALMIVLNLLGMIPLKYLILVAVLLFFFWCITLNSQVARRKKGTFGKVFSLLLTFCLFIGSYYVAEANDMISRITGGNYKVDKMIVAVRADDPAETLEDAADYTFGVQFSKGSDNMQAAVSDIQKQIGSEIQTTECDSVQTQAQQLLDGKVDAIIYNGAYTSLMEENVTDFSKKIKILYTFDIRVQLDFGNSGATDDSITKEPFTIYISGIDTYGEVSETSRSDVNLIAVVNPKTYQILLVTTPRDYYVPIPGISGGQKDKLTHAGIYGIDASMRTLGQLYETDINYYARLNFTSLIDIVDTLGGVDVYSELAFQTGKESGCIVDVQEGWNHLNGEQALAFSRERHALADGDNQRGKNQQAVLTAMLRKCLSPTMLLKAGTIMNQVSSEVETNLSQAQINSLIKYQLNKNATWTIQSVAATGTNDKGYCYSSGDKLLFIMDPDEDVVQKIIDLANVVEEGGTLEDGESLN